MSKETLTINKGDALQAFRKADTKGKQLLTDLLGDQVNFNGKIAERVKTFEDICLEAGVEPSDYDSFPAADAEERYINNFRKLLLIVRVLNEGWTPDYSDANQAKYYPWFEYTSGSGFRFGVFDCDRSGSHVGARLCYRTRELAEYAAQQFQDIYNEFLTFNQK